MKAHIQGLFGRYDAAINHKESIINNKESHYYNVTIEMKVRKRGVFGIVVSPSYE